VVVIVPMIMAVIMLCERGVVAVRVSPMVDGDRDIEAVRFGDLVDGFPIGSVIGEQKDLPRAVRMQGLGLDSISIRSG
jgi:hypothetical protein